MVKIIFRLEMAGFIRKWLDYCASENGISPIIFFPEFLNSMKYYLEKIPVV